MKCGIFWNVLGSLCVCTYTSVLLQPPTPCASQRLWSMYVYLCYLALHFNSRQLYSYSVLWLTWRGIWHPNASVSASVTVSILASLVTGRRSSIRQVSKSSGPYQNVSVNFCERHDICQHIDKWPRRGRCFRVSFVNLNGQTRLSQIRLERSIIVFNALSSLVRRARKFFCTLSASVSTIGKSIVKLSDHAT